MYWGGYFYAIKIVIKTTGDYTRDVKPHAFDEGGNHFEIGRYQFGQLVDGSGKK